MKAQVAGLLLLVGVSCAIAAPSASRQEHKLSLQQAKVQVAHRLFVGDVNCSKRLLWLTVRSPLQADPKSFFSSWVDEFRRAYKNDVEVMLIDTGRACSCA